MHKILKKSRLVDAYLSPFKKHKTKESFGLKAKRFKNRFALLLHRKRLFRFFYSLRSSTLKNHSQGSHSMLERKIDVALFRVNFCSSIRGARQAILHRKVTLNNRCLVSPYYFLKPGDIFAIQSESISMQNAMKYTSMQSNAKHNSMRNAMKHNSMRNGVKHKLSRKTPSFEVNYATLTAIYLFPAQFIATSFQWPSVRV